MSMFKAATVVAALATFSTVAAHGTVSGIIAGGKYYPGYNIGFAYQSDPPTVVGWSAPGDKDTGFIAPSNYTNPDIICHKDATPAGKYATVVAGSTVELQWTPWPVSHHGPVLDYLANCNGECTSVEKTSLKFNKIDGVGLLDDTTIPGSWASDKLIAANNSWTVTIPKSIAPGNYVLRHEIIALHSGENDDGAQNYPQCINLKVTGAGTDRLASGFLGEALYKETDPGIKVNIYQSLTYTVPGPKLYSGASIAPETSASAVAPSTSAVGSPSTSVLATTPVISGSGVSKTVTPPYPTITASYSNSTLRTGTGKYSKKPCTKTGTGKGHHHHIVSVATSTAVTSPVTDTPYVPEGPSKIVSGSTSNPEGSDSDSSFPAATSKLSTTGSAPIPCEASLDDMTVKQLLQLLESITGQLEKKMGGKMRRHAFGL